MRAFVRCLALLVVLGPAARAEEPGPSVREIERADAELPMKVEVELPAAGHVEVTAKRFPEGATFWVTFPEGDGHRWASDRGQARLSAGRHVLTVGDRWNSVRNGPVHLRIVISPENDPGEPDDDLEHARRVALGDRRLVIFPRADRDVLQVELPDRGYLLVTAPEPPEGFHLWCEITDPTGRALGHNAAHAAIPGLYTLAITDRWDAYGSREPIPLRIRHVLEDDPSEPNDTIEDAAGLTIGVWQAAVAAVGDDVDVFEIDVPVPGHLEVRTRDVPEGLTIVSQLSDAAGGTLDLAHPYPVEPGKYYLTLTERWNEWAVSPYRFRVDLLPPMRITPRGQREPALVEPGRSYLVRLPNGRETDRFAVALERLSIVRMTARPPEGCGYEFRVGDGADSRHGLPLWVRTAEPRPWFTIASPYDDVSTAPFPVTVFVEDEFDPSEPNDAADEATRVEIGRPQPFFLYPPRDVDRFRVRVASAGNHHLHVAWAEPDAAGRIQELHASWNDASGRRIDSFRMHRDRFGFASEPLAVGEPGEYTIGITGGGASRQPLLLRFSTRPFDGSAEAAASGPEVFVAGVELSEEGHAAMRRRVTAGGGRYSSIDASEDIGEKLADIAEEIEERSRPTPPPPEDTPGPRLLPMLLLAVLAAAGLGLLWVRLRQAR